MKWMCAVLVAFVGITLVANLGARADDKEAKEIKIKDVMQKCMKGGLCKKVASGEASDEEKAQLVVMFKAMSVAKPPKGDAESWKEKTAALVKGAEAAKAGDANAGKLLMAAANCKACHSVHK